MSARTPSPTHTAPSPLGPAHDAACDVTAEGAAWLASAETYPRSALAHWRARPDAPAVLPCGSAFDVVSVPAVFGRRMLDHLWDEGPGSGPVAVHRGRTLLFAAPRTAQRLPSLLGWEEWGARVPSVLCHGTGDAITVPPLTAPADAAPDHPETRWLVAPGARHPWLPGPEVLLWACVRAARGAGTAVHLGAVRATPPAARISIFPGGDHDAKVYDVSRRR
ncbi:MULTISPECIES: bifunctional DNA primase/polymerase [unclassified Streptomyces]|uniref:bifunctional DNA primase/polymerase n=1 Tax=unclassified Streptomyces TaxID=2593676 RepID=UPI000AE14555|nr:MULTISPECIES: bifunctional DNA primase/polymerase [unclassified Streptomyces]